jgi:methylated-DNA-[protein]-cysteine S-methyltransferase
MLEEVTATVDTHCFVMPWGGGLAFKHDGQALLHIRFIEPTFSVNEKNPLSSALYQPLSQAVLAYQQGDDALLKALPYRFPKTSTAFQLKVWQALGTLSWGQTCSYGQLAVQIGSPSSARAVGGALGKNPFPVLLPCHRVLGSQGQLTGFMGDKAGHSHKETTLKQALLHYEQQAASLN